MAKDNRDWLLKKNESWLKKVVRFLALVNQSDWRAKQILGLLDVLKNDEAITAGLTKAKKEFQTKNNKLTEGNKEPIPEADLAALNQIESIKPLHFGVIDCADNWVVEMHKEMGRMANDNEWQRFLNSPLDGKITMSFALQWRYNFGRLFGAANG